jgi:hypothetical protein
MAQGQLRIAYFNALVVQNLAVGELEFSLVDLYHDSSSNRLTS